jgi:hypothetical protein
MLRVQAQILRGRVTDDKKNPISSAVLFISEIAQGIVTDSNGNFQISLKTGSYTGEFSSLGYEKKSVKIVIDKPEQSIHISLQEVAYELAEVVVSPRREDPAYPVMRKAIAMAPYYLHQVKSYETDVYIKGSVKVNKMAKWIEKYVDELKVIKGNLFLMESHNELKFTSPDKYDQRVIALSSTFPKDLLDEDSPMRLVAANIYASHIRGSISPLSPNAFAYYRFTLEGKFREGNYLINKIRVEAKKNSPLLLNGWLYIVNDSWNVRSLKLKFFVMGIYEQFTINYAEIKPSVFLPVAYNIQDSIVVGLIGLNAEARYYASMKYKKIDVNEISAKILANANTPLLETDISTEVPPKQEEIKTKKQLKKEKELEALFSKEELTNKDAYKLAELMQKRTETDEEKQKRDTLELYQTRNINITIDSLAKSRDTLYWEQIRSLPLQADEVVSYKKKDTISLGLEEIWKKDSLKAKSNTWYWKVIFGSRVNLGKSYWLRFGGLLGTLSEYNFVDGVWLGQKLTFGKVDTLKKYALELSASAYYVTARKTVNWRVSGTVNYVPLKNGKLTLSGGNYTFGFSQWDESLRLINSIFSLIYAKNSIKFYQKRYIEVSNSIDAANGFIVKANIAYEQRNALENKLSYNFFNKSPSPNLPQKQLSPMPDNTLTKVALQLEYTPRYHYRIRNGQKNYAYSKYPTFTLHYEKGIPVDNDRSASFDKLEISIQQKIDFNLFNTLSYFVSGGTFLSSNRVYFPDFKHFSSNELVFTFNSIQNTFCIPNYSYSTDKSWVQLHISYTSLYLLIKNLPFLQKYLFNETLYARTLFISGTNYSELGYGLGFFGVIEAGVFVGFENVKYKAVGFALMVPLSRIMKF